MNVSKDSAEPPKENIVPPFYDFLGEDSANSTHSSATKTPCGMDNLYLSSGDTVIDIDTTVQKEERLCFCLFVHFLLKKKQRVATSTFLEEGGKEGRSGGGR